MIEYFAALLPVKVILDPTKNSACQGIGKYVSRLGLSLKDRSRKSDNYFSQGIASDRRDFSLRENNITYF